MLQAISTTLLHRQQHFLSSSPPPSPFHTAVQVRHPHHLSLPCLFLPFTMVIPSLTSPTTSWACLPLCCHADFPILDGQLIMLVMLPRHCYHPRVLYSSHPLVRFATAVEVDGGSAFVMYIPKIRIDGVRRWMVCRERGRG